jgi:hypothetical protein
MVLSKSQPPNKETKLMINLFGSTVKPFRRGAAGPKSIPLERPHLAQLAANEASLPAFVRACPVAMKYLRLLAPLDMDNAMLQFLLSGTVSLIAQELPAQLAFGQEVSLDTKHIVAWVAENNPKAYILESQRLDKTRQPKGDRDCKLGCKKKSNQQDEQPDKPDKPKKRATQFSCDRYFWGYNSGAVTTKVPGYGEFALAEMTLTFDKGDPTFFFPLLKATEQRLGFKPKFGAMDAAFDAWYCFDYFDQADGFAAISATKRQPVKRQFDEQGLPLCAAGLAMPLKSTFMVTIQPAEQDNRG